MMLRIAYRRPQHPPQLIPNADKKTAEDAEGLL
jgi:hypothetical protein